MSDSAKQKEEYAQAVCYFLAELLRNHRVSLPRAAEISEKVVGNINLIDTEKRTDRHAHENRGPGKTRNPSAGVRDIFDRH